MQSAFAQNDQFHSTFVEATNHLQHHQLTAALEKLEKALSVALMVSDDPVLADNGQQNVVTTSLIIMGVQFRMRRHEQTLATYHRLFHQLDYWLANATDRSSQKRLRGYQALAEKACRHLHLERLREEKHHAYNNK